MARNYWAIVAASTAVIISAASASALAQDDGHATDTQPQQTELRDAMRQMQSRIIAISEILSADDPNLAWALEPVRALQGNIVSAKLAAPPTDLGEIEQDADTSRSHISLGLASALRAAADLEVAILENNSDAAIESFNAIRAVQREGHNQVQVALRQMRTEKLLASLDDLYVSEELATSLAGTYLFEPHKIRATIALNDDGKLTIGFPEREPFVLMLQTNGDLHFKKIPGTIIHPVVEDGVIVSIEQFQSGNVYPGRLIVDE